MFSCFIGLLELIGQQTGHMHNISCGPSSILVSRRDETAFLVFIGFDLLRNEVRSALYQETLVLGCISGWEMRSLLCDVGAAMMVLEIVICGSLLMKLWSMHWMVEFCWWNLLNPASSTFSAMQSSVLSRLSKRSWSGKFKIIKTGR